MNRVVPFKLARTADSNIGWIGCLAGALAIRQRGGVRHGEIAHRVCSVYAAPERIVAAEVPKASARIVMNAVPLESARVRVGQLKDGDSPADLVNSIRVRPPPSRRCGQFVRPHRVRRSTASSTSRGAIGTLPRVSTALGWSRY